MQDLVIATNTFCDPKYRTNYFQFLAKHWNYKWLHNNYNCKAGWRVGESAKAHIAANNGVALWAPKFGRPPTPDNITQVVKSFLIDNSRLSSQKTTDKVEDELGNAVSYRHLDDSISGLYLEYALHTEEPIVSESTFRKLITKFKIFGDAHQDTDMCGYCIRGVELKRLLKPLFDKYEEYQLSYYLDVENGQEDIDMKLDQYESKYDIPKLADGNNTEKYHYPLQNMLNYVYNCNEFDDADEEKWKQRLTEFHAVMNHRWDKKKTNEAHKKDIATPPDRTIVIVADFKQNMVIGRSQIEVAESYRQSREPRSVLGFHVVTQTGRYFVDYVSNCTSKTSAYAVQCFSHLLDTHGLNALIAKDNI